MHGSCDVTIHHALIMGLVYTIVCRRYYKWCEACVYEACVTFDPPPCRYGRTEVLALGKFSLNVTGCPAPLPHTLHATLEHLLNKVCCTHNSSLEGATKRNLRHSAPLDALLPGIVFFYRSQILAKNDGL